MSQQPTYPRIYLYKRIVQAKLYIDEHFASPIDINNIAGEACFSRFHFIRQFKLVYGKTPHQYLISVRIREAMKLLRAGTQVADTCYSVGFESVTSFTSLFKKLVGLTPAVYLVQQQRQQQLMQQKPLNFIPGCHTKKNSSL